MQLWLLAPPGSAGRPRHARAAGAAGWTIAAYVLGGADAGGRGGRAHPAVRVPLPRRELDRPALPGQRRGLPPGRCGSGLARAAGRCGAGGDHDLRERARRARAELRNRPLRLDGGVAGAPRSRWPWSRSSARWSPSRLPNCSSSDLGVDEDTTLTYNPPKLGRNYCEPTPEPAARTSPRVFS